MAIHYHADIDRFRDDSGHFVSRDRAMHSSVARAEYEEESLAQLAEGFAKESGIDIGEIIDDIITPPEKPEEEPEEPSGEFHEDVSEDTIESPFDMSNDYGDIDDYIDDFQNEQDIDDTETDPYAED